MPELLLHVTSNDNTRRRRRQYRLHRTSTSYRWGSCLELSVPIVVIVFAIVANLVDSRMTSIMLINTVYGTSNIQRNAFVFTIHGRKIPLISTTVSSSSSSSSTSRIPFVLDKRHYFATSTTSLNLLDRRVKKRFVSQQPRREQSMTTIFQSQQENYDNSRRRRLQSYSLEDIRNGKDSNKNSDSSSNLRRPFPPMLDSLDEDIGYGASTYNEYDDPNQTINSDINGNNIIAKDKNDDDDDELSIEYSPQELKQLKLRELASSKYTNSFRMEDNIEDDDGDGLDTRKIVQASEEVIFSAEQGFEYNAKSTSPYVPETLETLQEKFDQLTKDIYDLNNGVEFNINASKQVSVALFGNPDETTNKDALQVCIATGRYPMASLVLEYRSVRNRMKSLQKKEDSIKKGTAVQNAFTIAKFSPGTAVAAGQSQQETTDDPVILIDASSYIFRAYYTMPPIHRGDGMPIGAVMGFCKMLNSLFLSRMFENRQNSNVPPRVIMCFDAKGKTFRHDMYTEYKANRPPAPIDLIPQFDLVRQAADAYGIHRIEAPYYEADDVIATMATMAFNEGLNTNILSGDKDLMQLVTPPPNEDDGMTQQPSIQLIDPATKDRTTYQQVVEKWAVPPNQLGDVLALAGDTADNIPGVAGIGPKIAASLITEFGSLDNLLENLDKIPQQKRRETLQSSIDIARLSRKLVELNCAVPQEAFTGFPPGVFAVSDLRIEPINVPRLVSFYDEMGFKELKRTLLLKSQGLKTARSKSSSWTKNQSRTKTTIPKPEDYADVPF